MALSSLWREDFLVVLYTFIFIIISIIVPKLLKEKRVISKFAARKFVHSFSGLAVFAAPYLNHPFLAVLIAAVMTIATRKSSGKSKAKPLRELFDAIGEEEELKVGYLQGPFAYCMAITILVFIFIFFPDKYYFPISATLVMMYADTVASIIGRKYGKHFINIPWVGSKRTLEGSFAFLVTALICSLFTFALLGQILPGHSKVLTTGQVFLFAVILSVISALLELVSPSKYDDLIIPLGATLIISLIAVWMHVW